MSEPTLIIDDCLSWLHDQPDNSVDLVFGSPPYETARTYGIGFDRRGEDWSAVARTAGRCRRRAWVLPAAQREGFPARRSGLFRTRDQNWELLN